MLTDEEMKNHFNQPNMKAFCKHYSSDFCHVSVSTGNISLTHLQSDPHLELSDCISYLLGLKATF